jgi:hypothetical protein
MAEASTTTPAAPATTPATTPAAPATGAKTPEKPADKPLTKDELKGVQRFASSFLTGEPPAPEKPETPEEKAAREKKDKDDAAKAAAKTTPAKPAPKKPAARKPESAKPLTTEEIAEAAARGVATALQPKPDAKPATKPTEPELSAPEKRKVAVLERMEKLYPDKYKGIADKYKTGLTALAKYADDWEKAHPGEPFDEDAEEHEDWFSKNAPDWEDDDFIEAVSDIKSDEKLAKSEEKTNERLTKFERAEAVRNAEPKIAAATHKPAALFWKAQGDEFAGHTKEDGTVVAPLIKEDGTVDPVRWKELSEKDPVTFSYRLQAAQALDAEVREAYKVMNGLVDYDGNNPVHVAISRFADQQEAELAAKPQDERLDSEGRDFLPATKYYKLAKDKRADYWTFSVDDLAALRSAALAEWSNNSVKTEEEKLTKWAEARGLKKSDVVEQPKQQPKPEDENEPEPTDDKPVSPSASSESRLAASKPGAAKKEAAFDATFLSRQLGK